MNTFYLLLITATLSMQPQPQAPTSKYPNFEAFPQNFCSVLYQKNDLEIEKTCTLIDNSSNSENQKMAQTFLSEYDGLMNSDEGVKDFIPLSTGKVFRPDPLFPHFYQRYSRYEIDKVPTDLWVLGYRIIDKLTYFSSFFRCFYDQNYLFVHRKELHFGGICQRTQIITENQINQNLHNFGGRFQLLNGKLAGNVELLPFLYKKGNTENVFQEKEKLFVDLNSKNVKSSFRKIDFDNVNLLKIQHLENLVNFKDKDFSPKFQGCFIIEGDAYFVQEQFVRLSIPPWRFILRQQKSLESKIKIFRELGNLLADFHETGYVHQNVELTNIGYIKSEKDDNTGLFGRFIFTDFERSNNKNEWSNAWLRNGFQVRNQLLEIPDKKKLDLYVLAITLMIMESNHGLKIFNTMPLKVPELTRKSVLKGDSDTIDWALVLDLPVNAFKTIYDSFLEISLEEGSSLRTELIDGKNVYSLKDLLSQIMTGDLSAWSADKFVDYLDRMLTLLEKPEMTLPKTKKIHKDLTKRAGLKKNVGDNEDSEEDADVKIEENGVVMEEEQLEKKEEKEKKPEGDGDDEMKIILV